MGKLATHPVVQPPRSAERERLADAIEHHRAAAVERTRIEQARQRLLSEVLFPAEDAAKTASREIAELQATESRTAAAAFLGDAEATDLAAPRRALEEAKATIARAETTRDGLDQRLRDATTEVERAKGQLDAAHWDAARVDGAIAALVDRYEKTKRELAALSRVMDAVQSFLPDGYTFDMLNRYFEGMFTQMVKDLPRDELEKWAASLARLRDDPDTELPS